MSEAIPTSIMDVCAGLEEDGWSIAAEQSGFRWYVFHSEVRVITIDMRRSQIPADTLRSIYRAAGWRWHWPKQSE